MLHSLETKLSSSPSPNLLKLQLKEVKSYSANKQVYITHNPDNEEKMILNIHQAKINEVNLETTCHYNELLLALCLKIKTPQYILQLVSSKCVERSDPLIDTEGSISYTILYKHKDITALTDILKKRMIFWSETDFTIFLHSIVNSVAEISKILTFQGPDWRLEWDAMYYDESETKFLLKVEPKIMLMSNQTADDKEFKKFVQDFKIDMGKVKNHNLIRIAFVMLQVYWYKDGEREVENYSKLYSSFEKEYHKLGGLLDKIIHEKTNLEELQTTITSEFSIENQKLNYRNAASHEKDHHLNMDKNLDVSFHLHSTYSLMNNVQKSTFHFHEYFTLLITKRENKKAVQALIDFTKDLISHKKYNDAQKELSKVHKFYEEYKLEEPTMMFEMLFLKFHLESQASNRKVAFECLDKSFTLIQKNLAKFDKLLLIDFLNKRLKFYQSTQTKTLNETVLPFGLKLDEKFDSQTSTMLYYILMSENLKLRKEYSDAMKCYSKALKLANKIYGGEISLPHAEIYSNIADINRIHGDFENAFSYYRKTLEIKEKFYEPNQPPLITCHEKVGLLNNEMREFKKALECFRRTLQMKKLTFGDQTIEVATTLNMIGTVYRSLNQYQLSLENYKRCYEIFAKAYGERHLAVATVLNNLGAISNKLNENDKALEYYEKSYDIFQAHFGDKHPIIGTCLNNIGSLYQSLHNHKLAIDNFIKSIDIHQKNNGETNETAASLHYSLGVSYENINEFGKAEVSLKKALEIARSLQKHESLDAVKIYKALGGLYKNMKNVEQSQEHYLKALKIQKKMLNSSNYEIANTLNLLGTLAYSAGSYQEAISYYEEALSILETEENNHKNVDKGYLLNNMASVYKGLNDNEKALDLYSKAMETFRSIHDKNHPTMGIILNNIGAINRLNGNNEEAIENYKEALEILTEVYGKYHPTVATLYNNIGTLYTYVSQPDEALIYLNKALKLSRVVIGENHAGIAALYFSIGKLYLTFDDYNKAQSHLHKALELYRRIYPEEQNSIFAKIYYGLGEAHRHLNEIPIGQEFHETALQIYDGLEEDDNEFEPALCHFSLGLIAVHNDDPNKAIDLFKVAMTYWEKKYGLSSVQVAQCCYQIGSTLRSMKDLDLALSYLTKAYEILDKSDSYGDFLMANVRSELGIIYQSLGDHPKALENHRHAYEIRKKKASNQMNYDLICSLNNVGLCYNLIGQYAKALDYTSKAYDGMVQLYGPTHSYVVGALINLGGITDKLGQFQDAVNYFQQALDIRTKNQNEEDDLEVAKIYNNLGGSYYHLGDYKKAQEYYSHSCKLRRAEYGEEHQEVATSYNNLGLVEDKLGNHHKALEYHNASLKIRSNILGEKHPSLAISLNNIGLTLQNIGDYTESLNSYLRALNIIENIYQSKRHPMIATILNNMAIVNKHLKRYEEGLKFHQKALEIQQHSFKEMHPEVATTINNIGELYYEMGNFKKSLDMHLRSLHIRSVHYQDQPHPELAASYNNCGSVYKAMGEYNQALDHYNKALTMIKTLYGDENPDTLILYLNLSNLYEKMGNSERAREFSDQHAAVQAKYNDQHIGKLSILAGI